MYNEGTAFKQPAQSHYSVLFTAFNSKCTYPLTYMLIFCLSPLEGKLKEYRDLAYFVHLCNNHGTYNAAWGTVNIQ